MKGAGAHLFGSGPNGLFKILKASSSFFWNTRYLHHTFELMPVTDLLFSGEHQLLMPSFPGILRPEHNIFLKSLITLPDFSERRNKLIWYNRVLKNETQKRWGLVLTTAEIWFNRGVDFSNLGKNQEALQAFDKALSIDPNNASVWYNKGIALSKLGLIQDSLDAFNKALSIDPNNANASIWYNKGITLRHLAGLKKQLNASIKLLR